MAVLLDLITARDGTTPRRDVVLPAHLIIRESTGPCPT
jgi:DNA-binding LacI/PurR family transcriptional regulator